VGFLLAPVAYEVVRSRHQNLSELQSGTVNSLMEEMRAEALAVVRQGTDREDLVETRQAYMRYVGQGHEIAVNLPVAIYAQADAEVFRHAFESAYEQLYGRIIAGVGIEVLSWTLTISEPEMEVVPDSLSGDTAPAAAASGRISAPGPNPCDPVSRQSCFDSSTMQRMEVPVYLRNRLRAGDCISGPALIAEDQTTTVVTAGYRAEIDERKYIVLTRIT